MIDFTLSELLTGLDLEPAVPSVSDTKCCECCPRPYLVPVAMLSPPGINPFRYGAGVSDESSVSTDEAEAKPKR